MAPPLVRRTHHDIRRARHQVEVLQNAVNTAFADEIALVVGDVPGQLTSRKRGLLQPKLEIYKDVVGDRVDVSMLITKILLAITWQLRAHF